MGNITSKRETNKREEEPKFDDSVIACIGEIIHSYNNALNCSSLCQAMLFYRYEAKHDATLVNIIDEQKELRLSAHNQLCRIVTELLTTNTERQIDDLILNKCYGSTITCHSFLFFAERSAFFMVRLSLRNGALSLKPLLIPESTHPSIFSRQFNLAQDQVKLALDVEWFKEGIDRLQYVNRI